jgi:hypothetical protein
LRAARAGAAAAALAAALGQAVAAQAPRAAGGVRLLEAAEQAPATLVGEIRAPEQLDRHGWTALLAVELSLSGPAAAGRELRIAWEELAESRAPRFAAGERVLLSLEPLPGASLWRERFPEAARRREVSAVAMAGDAFLRRPAGRDVTLLQHYLALAPAARAGAPGAARLVDLVAEAESALAADALRRLDAHAQLDAELGAENAARLAGALLRPGADEGFRSALAELIGRRQLASARPTLLELARRDPPPPPAVFEALALLDGELAPELAARLLAAAPPEQRRVAARHASGPGAGATLERLLRADPAPEVREAAVERLADLRGEAALDALSRALSDSAPAVRGSAARRLALLGTPGVTPLQSAAEGSDLEAASAAVVGLGLSSAPEARDALRELAAGHPDERLRKLAELALGRPLGHRH